MPANRTPDADHPPDAASGAPAHGRTDATYAGEADPAEAAPGLLALTWPVAMGYVPLGMVFGFLFVQAGGAWWLALAVSALVYAGAAQFVMIPMLAATMPATTIALAVAVVNLRHVFYGLSLLDRLPHAGWRRWYLAFALTDETYSLLTATRAGTGGATMARIAAANQGWWLLGTALGALVGEQAEVPLAGLDFALAALFAVLTVEQWRARASAAPLWVGIVAYAGATLAAPKHALALSILASIAAGALWREKPGSGGEPGRRVSDARDDPAAAPETVR